MIDFPCPPVILKLSRAHAGGSFFAYKQPLFCGTVRVPSTSTARRTQNNGFLVSMTKRSKWMAWEVDWNHPQTTGTYAWARNPKSYHKQLREWGLVKTASLRRAGINTPTYRKDSWEVDWSKRNGKQVWARNLSSKMPASREWHWISHKTLDHAGVAWKPYGITGRSINSNGYVVLSQRGMTKDEIDLANLHGLWKGGKNVWEHQLAAVKKYGAIPAGNVIRHINGIKHDNAPENLVLGTTQENTSDHNTARLQAMIWRERFENLERAVREAVSQTDPRTCVLLVMDALNGSVKR